MKNSAIDVQAYASGKTELVGRKSALLIGIAAEKGVIPAMPDRKSVYPQSFYPQVNEPDCEPYPMEFYPDKSRCTWSARPKRFPQSFYQAGRRKEH